MKRFVAIKFIRKDAFPPEKWDVLYARFDQEAKVLASLEHQNIIHIYENGIFDETPYYVMKYIKGETLKQRIVRKFSPAEAAEILSFIADVLESAYLNHILHRDVTPANIMFRKDGSLVLTDFGIAKLLNSEKVNSLTSAGFSIGTAEYDSPEQCLGKELDGRSFLYSRRNIPLQEATEVTAIPTEPIPATDEVEKTENLTVTPDPENDDNEISETETISLYSEIEPVENLTVFPGEGLPETGYVIDGCAMKNYLRPGDQAAVTAQRGLRLRENPAGNPTGVQASGENIIIEDSPVCVNGIVWLKVNYIGHHGWCMEGENGDYYLSKVTMSPTVPVSCQYPTHLEVGSAAKVINITRLKMYNEPEGSLLETQAFPGKPLEIIDGPQCRNGTLWWKISFLGYSGWVTEISAEGKYYLEPR